MKLFTNVAWILWKLTHLRHARKFKIGRNSGNVYCPTCGATFHK